MATYFGKYSSQVGAWPDAGEEVGPQLTWSTEQPRLCAPRLCGLGGAVGPALVAAPLPNTVLPAKFMFAERISKGPFAAELNLLIRPQAHDI